MSASGSTITAGWSPNPSATSFSLILRSPYNTMGNVSSTISRLIAGWGFNTVEATMPPGSRYNGELVGYGGYGTEPSDPVTATVISTAPVTSRLGYVLPAMRLRGTLTVQVIATVPPDAWPAETTKTSWTGAASVRKYHREWRYVNGRRTLVWIYKGTARPGQGVYRYIGNDFGKETRHKYLFRPRYARDRGWWYFKFYIPPWREGFYDTATGTSSRTFKTRAVKVL